jgi:hypothetical protein
VLAALAACDPEAFRVGVDRALERLEPWPAKLRCLPAAWSARLLARDPSVEIGTHIRWDVRLEGACAGCELEASHVALSADGRRLAVATAYRPLDDLEPEGDDEAPPEHWWEVPQGPAALLDLATGQRRELGEDVDLGLPSGLAFAPDGALLGAFTLYESHGEDTGAQVVAWSLVGERVWQAWIPRAHELTNVDECAWVVCIGALPLVACASTESAAVQIRDLRTGALLRELPTADGVSDLSMSADGGLLIAAGEGEIAIWDTGTWARAATIPAPERLGRVVVVRAPREQTLLAGSAYDVLRVWSLAPGGPSVEAELELETSIDDLVFADDGALLTLSAADGSAAGFAIGRVVRGQRSVLREIRAPRRQVQRFALGGRAVLRADLGAVELWRLGERWPVT